MRRGYSRTSRSASSMSKPDPSSPVPAATAFTLSPGAHAVDVDLVSRIANELFAAPPASGAHSPAPPAVVVPSSFKSDTDLRQAAAPDYMPELTGAEALRALLPAADFGVPRCSARGRPRELRVSRRRHPRSTFSTTRVHRLALCRACRVSRLWQPRDWVPRTRPLMSTRCAAISRSCRNASMAGR